MAEIEYGEFWLPGGSDAHPDNPLARCGLCSAIVLDTSVHSRWHAREQGPASSAPEPKQFEVWEFDDGEIGRFSWGKDPDGNLSLGACTDGPGWCIWEAWRGEANERTPIRKIGDTGRRPGEVSR